MNIGDYVRTKGGLIGKVIEIKGNSKTYFIPNRQENDVIEIIKSSPNILDLIQKDDYVNGMKVFEVIKNTEVDDIKEHLIVFINEIKNELFEIYGDDIKSIVTREMFESMEYKIGDKE